MLIDDGAQNIYGTAGRVSQVSGANTYYYLGDGLGSTMKTTDSTGAVVNAYTYDVYGTVTSSSGAQANEFQFAGEQTDPTGLQYLRARYYDPATGTFIAREPMSSTPGWSGNPTGYGAGNPTRYTDPTGLWPGEGIAKSVGSAVGNAADAVVSYSHDQISNNIDYVDATIHNPHNITINTIGRFVALYTVGDRHSGPDGFYWYENADGLGALLPMFGGKAAITLGNAAFTSKPRVLGSRRYCHELQHYEQSKADPLFPLKYYFNTDAYENDAGQAGAACQAAWPVGSVPKMATD